MILSKLIENNFKVSYTNSSPNQIHVLKIDTCIHVKELLIKTFSVHKIYENTKCVKKNFEIKIQTFCTSRVLLKCKIQ